MEGIVSAGGWALRAQTCPDNTVECKATTPPFNSCCPPSLVCELDDNTSCCPSSANCSASLQAAPPACANLTWTLYFSDAYFCCEPGFSGYITADSGDLCEAPGFVPPNGVSSLPALGTAAQGGSSTSQVLVSAAIIATAGSSSSSASPFITGTTSSVISTNTTATSSPQPTSSGSGENQLATKIGVGLGVPLGILILAILGFVCWRFFYRGDRHARNSPSSAVGGESHGVGHEPGIEHEELGVAVGGLVVEPKKRQEQ